MTRHLIQAYFGKRDRANLALADTGEKTTAFDIVAYDKVLDFGIGAALTDLKAKKVFPSEIALDLAVTAAHVHAADTRISRATESEDAWTRQLRVVVPVSNVERWTTVIPVLERMLNFLTGDRWTVQFRPRPAAYAQIVPQADLIVPPYTNVSLFSGGLDSFIGAIDQLEDDEIPLFVSHAGEPAVSKAQHACFDALKSQYAKIPFDRLRTWLAFPKKFVRNVGSEDSTRGRSFLFFALGVFAGTGLRQAFVLRAPENGLIALNVPLDALRLGALSTRTTHPFYIARWNELLEVLGIPGRVENPYWNQTKGEMVANCANRTFLKRLVPTTLSCSSPHQRSLAGSRNAALRFLSTLLDPQGIAVFDRGRYDLHGPKPACPGLGSTHSNRRADSLFSVCLAAAAGASREREVAYSQTRALDRSSGYAR
jgi:hypothetical protein